MTAYEAEAYVRGVERRSRAGWEQARFVAFTSLKPWSKGLRIEDIAEFPWEHEQPQKETKEERETALAEMRAMIPEIQELLNQKNGK